MTTSRNHSVDSIKGFLILLVVSGHISVNEGSAIRLLKDWLYCFHIPAFFIIGVLFTKTFKKEISSSFPLFVCYFFWLTLYIKDPFKITQSLIMSNWNNIKSVIWYLPSLITLKLIFSASMNCEKLAKILMVIFLLTLIFHNEIQRYHAYIPWGIDVVLYLLPIAFISKQFFECRIDNNESIISSIYKDNFFAFILFAHIFFFASLCFYFRIPINTYTQYHSRLDMAQFSVPGIEGYFYLLLINLSLIGFAKINIQENILSKIGQKSLSIFIFHLIIINIIKHFFQYQGSWWWLFNLFFSVLTSIAISTILLRISKKFHYIGA